MSLLGPQLDAFMAIVAHKTVHAAAESLHITQTAVTQRIRGLEQKLKTTLFIRTRKGMLLTQEAESLLHYCQAAKMLEGDCLAKIQGLDETTVINIGFTAASSMMHSRVLPSCAAIIKKFPKLRFHFRINDIENRHFALKSGQVDFAIIAPDHLTPEMKSKILKPQEYLLVAPKSWVKRPLKDIIENECIIDFDETDELTFNYLRTYGLFDHCRKDRHFINSPENLVELISQGVGYTVLTEEFYNLFAEQKQLCLLNAGKSYTNPACLCWYDRPEMPKYFKAVIDGIN